MTYKKGFTILISVGGGWGGFYAQWQEYSKRICLGWIAFTFLSVPDEVLADALNKTVKG